MRRRAHFIFLGLAAWVLLCAALSIYLFLQPAVKINLFGKLIVVWLAASLVAFVVAQVLRMSTGTATKAESAIESRGDACAVGAAERARNLEMLAKRAVLSAVGAVLLFAAAGALGLLG